MQFSYSSHWSSVACYATLHLALSVCRSVIPTMVGLLVPFLGSGPKGPLSCRTQGGISIRPSVRPSVRPSPPRWPSRPHILTLRPDLGPLSPQISSHGLKSALKASNPLSRPQISIPGLKSALQASNLPPWPKACPQTSNLIFRHKSPQTSNPASITS